MSIASKRGGGRWKEVDGGALLCHYLGIISGGGGCLGVVRGWSGDIEVRA